MQAVFCFIGRRNLAYFGEVSENDLEKPLMDNFFIHKPHCLSLKNVGKATTVKDK